MRDDMHLPTLADLVAALEQEANERLVPLPAPQQQARLTRLAKETRWLGLPFQVRRGRRWDR